MGIVTLGSLAWAALILTIGLCTGESEPSQVAKPAAVPTPKLAQNTNEIILVKSEPAPNAAVPPSPQPLSPGGRAASENDAAPIVAAPKLRMRALRPNDTVPAILIDPEIEAIPARGLPPEPPQAEKPPTRPLRKDVDLNVYASCEQIGTNLLFMKDPTEAFQKARDQKRLVFMVHLSGNLEDKEFT
jgi:hypothetical protein